MYIRTQFELIDVARLFLLWPGNEARPTSARMWGHGPTHNPKYSACWSDHPLITYTFLQVGSIKVDNSWGSTSHSLLLLSPVPRPHLSRGKQSGEPSHYFVGLNPTMDCVIVV